MKKARFTKEQIEELYINQNLTREEVCKALSCSLKCFNRHRNFYDIEKDEDQIYSSRERRCEAKYGVRHHNQTLEMRNKLKQKNKATYATGIPQEKIKATFIKHFGVDNPAKADHIKAKIAQTNLERYGSVAPAGNHEIITKIKSGLRKAFSTGIPQEKAYQTMKKNGTLNKRFSKQEEQAYQLLLSKFDKDDIIRQYKSKLYPFNCDFYIKSLDLYIEYQGSHYHYKEAFNENNLEHLKRVKKLQIKIKGFKVHTQYHHMLKVWAETDPLKRQVAKQNNLNWKEFFTIQEVKDWLSI